MDPAYIDAVAYYRTRFPTLDSLGAGTPPAAWQKEFDSVAPEAFDATLGTNVALEGGSIESVLNFRQVWKVRALHARRAELDAAYQNPYMQAVPDAMLPRIAGFRVRMGR